MRSAVPPNPQPDLTWTYNEAQGSNELAGETIGLSLSGGGYRATLFAAGAIAAICDAGLWGQVRWTASVSGGSFVNAAAALILDDAPQRSTVDSFIRAVAERTRRPLSLVGLPGRVPGARGPSLVARAYQAGIERSWLGKSHRGTRLADLRREGRIHAFLAVDLATLSPVFLTDWAVVSRGLEEHVALEPGDLLLSTVVRASASFPLLPAVRVRRSDLGTDWFNLDKDLFLGDGGVWNNLGTHWEEQIRWLRRDLFDLPTAVPESVDWHVVVDASAPPTRPSQHRTRWPIWALDRPLASVDRSMRASLASTVEAGQRALRTEPGGFMPRRVMHVQTSRTPHDDQPREALVRGVTREIWADISDYNCTVKTVRPTLLGLDSRAGVHLLAHGYVQAASALTVRGVPFDRFQFPHDRISAALE